jgi:hypothetical protein
VDESLRPIGKPYPRIHRTSVVRPLSADPWRMSPGFAMVLEKALLEIVDWRSRPPSRDLNDRPMDFDEWLYLLAWSVGEIGFLDRCLVLYRQHAGNVCGSPRTSYTGRLRKLLVEDFASHSGRASVARSYAEFLEQTSRAWLDVDAGLAQQLSAGARYWQRYGDIAERRDGLYTADSFLERLERLSRLVVSNAYRSRETGGLGSLALARDVRELVVPRRGAKSAPARFS